MKTFTFFILALAAVSIGSFAIDDAFATHANGAATTAAAFTTGNTLTVNTGGIVVTAGALTITDSDGTNIITSDDANTETVVLTLRHTTTDAAADNDIIGLDFSADDDNNEIEVVASIDVVQTDVSDGSENADMVFRLHDGGDNSNTQRMILTSAGALTTDAGITATTGGLTATAGALTITDSDGTNTIISDDANTETVILTLSHTTTDAAADNDIISIDFTAEDDNNENEVIASIEVIQTDVSDTTEDADISWKVHDGTGDNSLSERMRLTSAGALTTDAGITATTGGLTATAGALTITDSDGTNTIISDDANTETVILTLSHTTTDAAADNDIISIDFTAEDDNNENEVIASIEVIQTDVSDTTEDADISWKVHDGTGDNSLSERMRLTSVGNLRVDGSAQADTGLIVGTGNANQVDFIKIVSILDGNNGFDATGAASTFTITGQADLTATTVVAISFDDGAAGDHACSVVDIASASSFVIDCAGLADVAGDAPPPNGTNLNYIMFFT